MPASQGWKYLFRPLGDKNLQFLLAVVAIFLLIENFLITPSKPATPLGSVKTKLEKIEAVGSDQAQLIQDSFDKKFETAQTDVEKFFAYHGVYNNLWARYNVTKDEKVLAEMKTIESTLATQWPDLYKTIEEGGGFLK